MGRSLYASYLAVVALRIELSALFLSERDEQPALDDRSVIQVGYLGVEPKSSCSQSRRAAICTSTRCVPLPLLYVRTSYAVDWEALESSSSGLQPDAKPSQLPVRFFQALNVLAFRRR